MIISQLIGTDITQSAFYLFGIRYHSNVDWYFKGFGSRTPSSNSFRKFRLELIK